MRVGSTLRVVRDSDDLGLDRGMRAIVVRVRRGERAVDLYVPALDMLIASVADDHPDMVRAS